VRYAHVTKQKAENAQTGRNRPRPVTTLDSHEFTSRSDHTSTPSETETDAEIKGTLKERLKASPKLRFLKLNPEDRTFKRVAVIQDPHLWRYVLREGKETMATLITELEKRYVHPIDKVRQITLETQELHLESVREQLEAGVLVPKALVPIIDMMESNLLTGKGATLQQIRKFRADVNGEDLAQRYKKAVTGFMKENTDKAGKTWGQPNKTPLKKRKDYVSPEEWAKLTTEQKRDVLKKRKKSH